MIEHSRLWERAGFASIVAYVESLGVDAYVVAMSEAFSLRLRSRGRRRRFSQRRRAERDPRAVHDGAAITSWPPRSTCTGRSCRSTMVSGALARSARASGASMTRASWNCMRARDEIAALAIGR